MDIFNEVAAAVNCMIHEEEMVAIRFSAENGYS